jgi:protein TonB
MAAHKIYPEAARRRGEEGRVTLRFTVAHSGEVADVAVVQGSGSPRLDAAAEAMLRGATVPPFDVGMGQTNITATVQVRYALAP